MDSDPALRARWLDVSAAMADLSSLERTALVMTAVEGATYEEAGRVLGTTAGALRAAVSRARTKLETA
jgi:DNA-directed RNA polymerase specialized sigma24 family protein